MDPQNRPPAIAAARIVAVVAAALLILAAAGAVATSSYAAGNAGHKKPHPTATSTSTSTPTATVTATPTETVTPTQTATPAVSPTRSCTLVTYQAQSWCIATTAEVNAGTYPAGARVMLREVHVEAIAGTLVTVSCQAPYFCDATAPGGTLNVDFAGLADIPSLWHWVDLYGTTGASGVLQPAGFVDRTYEGA